VDDGDVAIEHQDVVLVDGESFECCGSVVGDVDGVRLLTQPLGDRVGEPRLVLHYQYAHACAPSSAPAIVEEPAFPRR
jgi:hypothetical protein